MAAECALNRSLRETLEAAEPNAERVQNLLEEGKALQISLDEVSLGHALKNTLEGTAEKVRAQPEDLSLLQDFEALAGLARGLPFAVDFWKAQNIFFELLQTVYPERRLRAEEGEEAARAWLACFASLGEKLHFRVD
jgi:predicted unusual protein kinase regulating ubiquinone biosynthesis (AarF/ABC1/UbiB family)